MGGTSMGVLRSVGSSTVRVGTMRIRFEVWGLKDCLWSFILSMSIIAARNIVHSRVWLVRLLMSMLRPKYACVMGQKS